MQQMRQGGQFQTYFCFLKYALYEVKASGLQLSFTIYIFFYIFFSFYHNKIHPETNYNPIKNKINKTR